MRRTPQARNIETQTLRFNRRWSQKASLTGERGKDEMFEFDSLKFYHKMPLLSHHCPAASQGRRQQFHCQHRSSYSASQHSDTASQHQALHLISQPRVTQQVDLIRTAHKVNTFNPIYATINWEIQDIDLVSQTYYTQFFGVLTKKMLQPSVSFSKQREDKLILDKKQQRLHLS